MPSNDVAIQRPLPISYGKSSHAKYWRNETITWGELSQKLRTTIHTRESVDEYRAMSKDERSAVKNCGGFFGGHLKGNRRLAKNVQCRSILTMDVDGARPGLMEEMKQNCKFATTIYTTHSHRPEAPRLRILIPLQEDISPDMYVALARYFAGELGIDQVDPCSFRVNQMMYWPTTSADGEFMCEVIDGAPLDAREFLSKYPDWQDCSKWPVSISERCQPSAHGKKAEDPLTKTGIVGAFCRTYSVEDVIDRFLSKIYAPAAVEGRYTFLAGEGTAGLVIYDDGRFAYSFHATDPAGGRLLNAFDLVAIHKYGDLDEKSRFQKMCTFAEKDVRVKETLRLEKEAEAQAEFEEITSSWEEPIPFGKYKVDPFPVDALPKDIRDHAVALSECTQTPVDMAGCADLSMISACAQGKFVVGANKDWVEPLNTYTAVTMRPSERKSAVANGAFKPGELFERQYNKIHEPEMEASRMQRRILERRQKAIEDLAVKDKATNEDVMKISKEVAEYKELKPYRLFVDDVTLEKLVSLLDENDGRMALLSSEAGILDNITGAYSKVVNIDALLKSYSGDTIRVDRVGRPSEYISHPCLTIFLMAQPSATSKFLNNESFRGRGLTARFLYSVPASHVGDRQYRGTPVPQEVYDAYERKIFNILEDEYSSEPEVITLSPEADLLLEKFAQELEPKLVREYAEISDWCGKLVGNTLRIAGLLCRAGTYRSHDFLDVPEPLVVDEQTMKNAIRLGRYFLSHALAAFDVMPENSMYKNAYTILRMIHDKKLTEFTRRDVMRNCQTFKRAEAVQPVLDFLEDYGYIKALNPLPTYGRGRPPMAKYLVNPLSEGYLSHIGQAFVRSNVDRG